MLGVPCDLYTRLAHADHQMLTLRHRCRNLHTTSWQTHEIPAKTKQWESHKYRNVDGLEGLEVVTIGNLMLWNGGHRVSVLIALKGESLSLQPSLRAEATCINLHFLSLFLFFCWGQQEWKSFFFFLDQSYYDYDYAERPAGEKCCNRN